MFSSARPKIVVTIHGIRTYGKWQKKITPFLAKHGLIPYHVDFGFFHAITFFIPFFRERKVQAVREELRGLISSSGARRVSVVAHSFGTYIALAALRQEHGELRYDRIVLTGSILPRDFDWSDLFDRKWAVAAYNVRADSDWVVGLADFISRRLRRLSRLEAGDSGRRKFIQNSPFLLDDELSGDHSAAHNELKFEKWARFIAYPQLAGDVLERIVAELQAVRQLAASVLLMEADKIRVNLLAPRDGVLRLVPGAFDNMTYAPEFDMKIQPGHGSAGVAFASGHPSIIVKNDENWSGSHLPGDELDKVHPSLRWALSFPLRSETRGLIVGVINVDGLESVPRVLDDVNSTACQSAVAALYLTLAARVSPCLETAFRGDMLEQIEV